VLFSHEPNNTLLVPDSCRLAERTGNSITTNGTKNTIDKNDALALADVLDVFDIAESTLYTYIVGENKRYLHSLRNGKDNPPKTRFSNSF
jgi:hypothetical protein